MHSEFSWWSASLLISATSFVRQLRRETSTCRETPRFVTNQRKMLNGREKVGVPDIEWDKYALGKGKYRRKTWGFGKYDKKEKEHKYEIYIRELSILEGGIGCAVWDAAVIMSRWIYHNKNTFKNKTVIELGSGCGLPGILAGAYASQVVLTDYIPQILENLHYNVSLNCGELSEESKNENSNNNSNNISSEQLSDDNFDDMPVSAFRERIRKNTKVMYLNWDEIEADATQGENLEPADIIMGSELTYSPLSVDTLVKVTLKFLKRDGVFYEVLSDDRDGVALFLEKIRQVGITVAIHPVPEAFLGNYNTKQRPETYKLYTFKFPESTMPDMK